MCFQKKKMVEVITFCGTGGSISARHFVRWYSLPKKKWWKANRVMPKGVFLSLKLSLTDISLLISLERTLLSGSKENALEHNVTHK